MASNSVNFEDLTKLEKQGLICASLSLSFSLAMRQIGDKIIEETEEDTMTDFEKGKLAIVTSAMDHLQTQMSQCTELYLLAGFTILAEFDEAMTKPTDEFSEGMMDMLEQMGITERYLEAKKAKEEEGEV